MSKRRNPQRRVNARQQTSAAAKPARPEVPSFTPVALKARHDGFTPERQQGFIEALAECGCVEEACGRVGISSTAAYALRRRIDAISFRQAWEAALDYAVRRLTDAVLSRAINGVSRPIFYKGEQVGERRYYDDRLAQFILRYRDPTRYGKFMDRMTAQRPPDAAAQMLNMATDRAMEAAYAMADGEYPDLQPLVGIDTIFPTEIEQYEREVAEVDRESAATDRRRAMAAQAQTETQPENQAEPEAPEPAPILPPLYEPWVPPPVTPPEWYRTAPASGPRVRLLGGDFP